MRIALLILLLLCACPLRAEENVAERLAKIDLSIFAAEEATTSARRSVSQQLQQANDASSAAWTKIRSRADWEAFRREKLAKLRQSLRLPSQRAAVKVHHAGELTGEGYKIQKLIYETRPGWFVTANLYLPASARASMPGILLSHSHHSPKTQGELQDMGATWSRAGCAVLVPDHLGHGERRQHPFGSAADYEKEFPLSRQDYHFRYDASLQLYLCGESLMGWLVHDLMGGVDVLLGLPGIDATKIILLGGVAGGGDPAAVTGAVDERIACVGPFNFGGPQPETRYPLPNDAETSFHYAGSGSWESTRNLASSAHDGFLPWVIVGSIAPRKLIYGHEFSWDRARDPVYRRFERIWSLYDQQSALGFAHGRGTLRGNKPEDTHCGNIGAYHRRMIHPLLKQWFEIEVTEADEYSHRRDARELHCWTAELKEKLQPRPLHQILREQAQQQITQAKERLPDSATVRDGWAARLGIVTTPPAADSVEHLSGAQLDWPGAEAWHLTPNDGPALRILFLPPTSKSDKKLPLVIAAAQSGQSGFLRERRAELARLLSSGVAVALVDVRHTGISAGGTDRGQSSEITAHSASYLMLGRTLLGAQVNDLRLALAHLRQRDDIDRERIILWGESFAEPRAAGASFQFPRRVDRPGESDPLGPHLVLITAAFEPDLHGVVARGGLSNYSTALASPFVQWPHNVVVPNVFAVGDLGQLVDSLEVRRILRADTVDGLNRRADTEKNSKDFVAALLVMLQS